MNVKDKRPHLVLVGGFLGAGKTSLILAAVQLLEKRGVRTAIILNDQGDSLVDTEFVEKRGVPADQVTGGCFCCRFSDLIDAAERLKDYAPQVIFAEPVGSCVDLAATVIRPLQHSFGLEYRIAPLSVLIDPALFHEWSGGHMDVDMAFLFQHQLEEADLVCFTKSDLHPNPPAIPNLPNRQLSAASGQGVAAWIDELFSGDLSVGGRALDVDYECYARAEAALAWLNFRGTIEFDQPVSPSLLIGPLIDAIDAGLTAQRIRIAHLKTIDTSEAGFLKAAICVNGQEPATEGRLDASPAVRHELLLNLRALGDPAIVRKIVEDQLRTLPGRIADNSLDCFQPAPPKPEHRLDPIA